MTKVNSREKEAQNIRSKTRKICLDKRSKNSFCCFLMSLLFGVVLIWFEVICNFFFQFQWNHLLLLGVEDHAVLS